MPKFRIELFRTMKPDYAEVTVEASSIGDARRMACNLCCDICEGSDTNIKWTCADVADEIGISDIAEL